MHQAGWRVASLLAADVGDKQLGKQDEVDSDALPLLDQGAPNEVHAGSKLAVDPGSGGYC